MCSASQRCGVCTTLVFAASAGAEGTIRLIEDRLTGAGVTVRWFVRFQSSRPPRVAGG